MRIGKAGSASGAYRLKGAGSLSGAGGAGALQPVNAANPAAATASVLGVPEAEFTPRVRDAMMALMAEVERLRRDLELTRRQLEEAGHAADQDVLLPVLNRRAFVREITRFIAFAERYGTPSSLLYFDLDGFKAVNDAHGHAAGDAVLRHFAQILSSQIRNTDVIGRLGGDEFGVILAHVTLDQTGHKSAKLARALHDNPPLWQGRPVAVSFSYGTCELCAGINADSAVARADEAMYANKRAGR